MHERGDFEAAEHHYRAALKGPDGVATARSNLGVVLEDQDRAEEALEAYHATIDADPHYADAYYNLAGLYERLDQKDLALRHLKTYKQLVEP